MRVALIDPSLFTLPYDVALAGGLRACGHTVTLHGRRVAPDDGADAAGVVPSFYPISGSKAARFLPRPIRLGVKGVDHIASMASLASRLKREMPSVIHFQWLPLPMVDRVFLPRLRPIAPLVLTVHDSNPFNGDPAARLQRHGVLDGLSCFDRIIVHTEQGHKRLRAQGIAGDRITVIPHGLLGTAPAESRSGAETASNETTFVLFGKIKPYKGADLLISAFGRLPRELQERARIRIVGKSYMNLEPLRELAKSCGVDARVSIETGFVADSDIPDLFGPGTVAAFPYREIEASGVLSLAISFGRPIVAARLGGFAETVSDGTHGLLFPPEDIESLSNCMARFISDANFSSLCAEHVAALARTIPEWGEIGRLTSEVYASANSA